MPEDFPVSAIPGSEAGFVAASVVMELVNLLVEKRVITRGEVTFMLQSLKERAEKDNRAIAKQATGTLDNWVHVYDDSK